MNFKNKYILDLEDKLIYLYIDYNNAIRTKSTKIKKLNYKIMRIESKIANQKLFILKMKKKLVLISQKNKAHYIKEINSSNRFLYMFKNIWKQLFLVSIAIASFTLLISAYTIGSHYDLNIAN